MSEAATSLPPTQWILIACLVQSEEHSSSPTDGVIAGGGGGGKFDWFHALLAGVI